MFQVGEVDSEAEQLIKITELCLHSAIQICKPNQHFYKIGNNVAHMILIFYNVSCFKISLASFKHSTFFLF